MGMVTKILHTHTAIHYNLPSKPLKKVSAYATDDRNHANQKLVVTSVGTTNPIMWILKIIGLLLKGMHT